MTFDFFRLHDSNQDINVRRLLRVYSVTPKFSTIKSGKRTEQAIFVTNFLNKINVKLKAEIGQSWKKDWIGRTGYRFSQSSLKDWFIGRASIPVIAIEKLKEFGVETEVEELMQNVDYISSTTRDIVKIPKDFTPDLLYLCGIVLGDGSLSVAKLKDGNYEYDVKVHSGDKENLMSISGIIQQLFDSKSPGIYFFTNKFGASWTLQKPGKAIYRFLVKIVGIPNGKKGRKSMIPDTIKFLPPSQTVPFLSGLVDSDIGRHSSGMGCTFCSKQIVDDLIELLAALGVKAKHYGSHYKDNLYIQHDFSIPKSQVKRFKDVLTEVYLPKRRDRLQTLHSLSSS